MDNLKVEPMKISVIVAVYNNISYLSETLKSILFQDYSKVEIVVCDDCSTQFSENDLLLEISKINFGDKKLKVIRNLKNLGTVKNLDNAYKQSSGELLVNLSCGDVFADPYTLSKISNYFTENKCDNLVCSRILCDENMKYLIKIPPEKFQRYLNEIFKDKHSFYFHLLTETHYFFPSGSAFCILREAYLKYGGYDQDYLLIEDFPFFSNLAYDGKLNYTFEIVSVKYRKGGVSNSKKPNQKILKDLSTYYAKESSTHNDLNFLESRIKKDFLNFKLIQRNKFNNFMFLIFHPFLTIFKLKYKINFYKMYKGLF